MLEILITILFILLPFGQLERIPLKNPQIGLYAHDLVVAAVFVLLIKEIISNHKLVLGKFGKPIIFFLLIAFISLVINIINKTAAEIFIGSSYFARLVGFSGIYFAFLNIKTKSKPEFFKQLVILSAFAAAVFGIIQYLVMPDIRPLTLNEWDPHYYRVVGTFLEPGFAGLVFVIGLVFLITKLWGKIKKENLVYYFMALVSYVSLSLTYSRSAYAAFAMSMAIIAYVKRSLWFFIITMFLFAGTLAILPRPGGEGVKLERQSTVLSRYQNWQQGLLVFKDHPLLGVGFNLYRYAARDYGFLDKNRWQYSHAGAGIDNSLIFVLVTTGVVGFGAFIYLIFSWVKWAFIGKNERLLFLAVLGGLVIHGFFNNTLFYSFVILQIWVILGFTESK